MTKQLSLVHQVRQPLPDPAKGKPPMLILLHGVGSNEHSMMARWEGFDRRLLVVSARSPIQLKPSSFAWFHVRFTAEGPVIDPDEAEAAWENVIGFIDEAVRAYGADVNRVYLGGFSQGAIISLAALLTAPERIAGVVAMSGRLLPEVLPHAVARERLRGRPILIVHGTLDERLGIQYARSAREQLERLGLTPTYRELDIGHTTTEESLALVSSWLSARLDQSERREEP
jgi:phospholipase/carboxylesterase